MSYTDDEYCDVIQQQQAKIDRLQAAGDALAEFVKSEIRFLIETADTYSNVFAAPMYKKAQALEQLLAAWNQAKEMT